MQELAGYKSRILHRDRNLEIFTSVDIKISLYYRDGCVNLRANNLGIFYPIIPSERIKTRAMLDIRHAQFGDQNHPARRTARYFRSVFQSRWKSRSFLCMNGPNNTFQYILFALAFCLHEGFTQAFHASTSMNDKETMIPHSRQMCLLSPHCHHKRVKGHSQF